jgi:hypothetical protein
VPTKVLESVLMAELTHHARAVQDLSLVLEKLKKVRHD